MSYWWQNPILKMQIKGKTILKVSGEGCQAVNEFKWLGKIVGFQKNKNLNCDDIVVEILIHNYSSGDFRANNEKEIFTYPLVNADIQNVNGAWILFA